MSVLRYEPFRPFDFELLLAQGLQRAQRLSIVPADYATFRTPIGVAMTAWAGERVVMCGGVATSNGRHGLLWALVSETAGRHMLELHRGVTRFLRDHARVQRLEATVEFGFFPGCRWLRLLGFRYEGLMPGYGDRGETHLRFGRVSAWPT